MGKKILYLYKNIGPVIEARNRNSNIKHHSLVIFKKADLKYKNIILLGGIFTSDFNRILDPSAGRACFFKRERLYNPARANSIWQDLRNKKYYRIELYELIDKMLKHGYIISDENLKFFINRSADSIYEFIRCIILNQLQEPAK